MNPPPIPNQHVKCQEFFEFYKDHQVTSGEPDTLRGICTKVFRHSLPHSSVWKHGTYTKS